MKVLHVLPSLELASGGPARSVPALCSAEVEAGADVALISFASDRDDVAAGVETISLAPLRGTRQGLTPAFVREVFARTDSADVMHIHSLWNPPTSVAMTIARRRRLPYVISPRGVLQKVALTQNPRRKRLVAALGEARKIKGANGIHFLTHGEARSSTSFALPSRQVVIPNGIDPDIGRGVNSEAIRELLPELGEKRIILFLGRLHWSKGLDVQFEAMSHLAAQRDDFLWVLIGPDEGGWESLSGAASLSGLSGRLRWLRALPHATCLEATKAADVMLITSRHEAHSMAMNEALALGTPLVMTDTVGFPAAAEAGAALVVPADPGQIAAATSRVLDDAVVVTGLKEAGSSFVREFLAWPRVAKQMIAFYESVIGGVR